MRKDGVSIRGIMTPEELGGYLKLTKSTIYKLASKGQLPGFKIGDSWRFDRADVLKLVRGTKIAKENRDTKGTRENGEVGQSHGAGEKGSGVDG